MVEEVIEAVRAIIERKRNERPNVVPCAAGFYEIRDRMNATRPTDGHLTDADIRQALREACRLKRLKWYKGLNYNYFI